MQSAPAGDKFGITYVGADHEFIGRPTDVNFAGAAAVTTDFLRAYALADKRARKRLTNATDTATVTWTRR